MVKGAKEKIKITGRKKTAIMLLVAGPEIAAEIYRHFSDNEIEQITLEVSNIGTVPFDLRTQCVEEFYHTVMAATYIPHGGISTSREILEKAVGPGKAMEIIERLQGMLQGRPFDFLQKVDPNHLFTFIRHERPQVIALILAHLDYDQSTIILETFPTKLRNDVMRRIATLDHTSPEILSEVERVLERKIATVLSQEFCLAGGVKTVAELTSRLAPEARKAFLADIEKENPSLSHSVKECLFSDEDLLRLENETIKEIFENLDTVCIANFLKGSREEIRQKVFHALPAETVQLIQENMNGLESADKHMLKMTETAIHQKMQEKRSVKR